MSEKVSVIVPIYNVDVYLSRCIDSLLNQTYANLEIILVDDCSTDCSNAIAKKYANEHPDKCVFIQREQNGGLSAGRNTGIARATGEWLAFVDSDDWVAADYISAMYEVALRDSADIVISGISYYYSENKIIPVSPFGSLTTQDSQKLKVAVCKPYSATRLYRRCLFSEYNVEYPEGIRRGEDIATIIPLLTRTEKISILDKSMYFYQQRSTSLSNQNQKNVDLSFYPKAIRWMFEKSAPGFEEELQFRAVSELVYGMTMLMLRSGRSKREIREHLDTFDHDHPSWRENRYLSMLPKGKQIFIKFASNRQLLMLRLFIAMWDLKLKIKG
jgi:glycosyltransferase involved in cell wall biosynthesis